MSIYNAVEKIVSDLFTEFEKNYALSCNCVQCKEDILAIVLNKIPPRYISTRKGELYVKTLYLNQQLQSDVMRELMNAALVVEKNYHHH